LHSCLYIEKYVYSEVEGVSSQLDDINETNPHYSETEQSNLKPFENTLFLDTFMEEVKEISASK
jgi:hypothetical protein